MTDAKVLSDGVRQQTERALFSWSRDVLEALGDVSALGEFRVESTHQPYRFEISSGENALNLSARDTKANDYRGQMICYFTIPAWLLRDESSNRLESGSATSTEESE